MTQEIEIIPVDRLAAASVAVLSEMRDLILAEKAEHHAEPFARHRLFEREIIVDWLREGDDPAFIDAANAIEAGEHWK